MRLGSFYLVFDIFCILHLYMVFCPKTIALSLLPFDALSSHQQYSMVSGMGYKKLGSECIYIVPDLGSWLTDSYT